MFIDVKGRKESTGISNILLSCWIFWPRQGRMVDWRDVARINTQEQRGEGDLFNGTTVKPKKT